MVRLSYSLSWYFRHPLEALSTIWNDMTCGVRNVVKWFPIIWFDQDYDHLYLTTLLEFKLRNMSKRFNSPACPISDGKKLAKQTLMAAELCKRMQDDINYVPEDGAPELGPWIRFSEDKVYAKDEKEHRSYWDYMRRQDLQMLGRVLEKHMLGWWD